MVGQILTETSEIAVGYAKYFFGTSLAADPSVAVLLEWCYRHPWNWLMGQ